MNVQTEHLENHTARLTVELEAERLQKALTEAAKRIGSQVNIPGFRKGKAPTNVITRYVGQQAVLEEAMDKLGNQVYQEAIQESKIEPYGMGSLENIKTEPTPVLIFVVPKRPEADLGDYRETLRLPYKDHEVTEASVDTVIRNVRDERAIIEAVDRPTELGDKVKVHLAGTISFPPAAPAESAVDAAPGEPIVEDVDEENEFIMRNDEDDSNIPGLVDQLVGMKTGEEKTFTIHVSDEEKHEEFRNATAQLTATMLSVSSVKLPELNDDFAAVVTDGEFTTVETYRAELRKRLETLTKQMADEEYQMQVINQLVANATISYPEEAIQDTIGDLVHQLEHNLADRNLSMTQHLQIQKMTMDELRESYREQAVEQVRRSAAFSELIDREKIDVSPAELEARVQDMLQRLGDPAQSKAFETYVRSQEMVTSFLNEILQQKGFARMTAIARGENPPLEKSVDTLTELPSETVVEPPPEPVAEAASSTSTDTEPPTTPSA